VGPATAGFALEYLGAGGLPAYYLIILALFSIILMIQLIRSRIVERPEDHESQYVAMIRTSPNVLPLHPESEQDIDEPMERRSEAGESA
jgi:hypothetical protein